MRHEFWKNGITILDGAMGTVLQQRDLPPGEDPALLSLTRPQLLLEVHRAYVEAGAEVIYANTFGANGRKLAGTGRSVREVVSASVALAREAAGDRAAVGLDVGPIGELMEPMGALTFDAAYDLFAEVMEAGAEAGADLVAVETFTSLLEAKAALLAAKERTSLPVFVTMSFEETGRTFTGCTIPSMAHTLEGLGADAIGLNCSLGPDRLAPMIGELARHTHLPVIAKPNAGLPDPIDGHYGMAPKTFAAAMESCRAAGATLLGGCCGTDESYISLLARAMEDKAPAPRTFRPGSFVCTATRPLFLDGTAVIGERINPTGKKLLRQALLDGDLDHVLDLAVRQEDAGADILDVNVGCPGVEEAVLLPAVVKKLQSAVSIPLMLDSADPKALEAALRVYNGKAAVNSVNGDPASLAALLPVVKKYGAAVVGLCLDERGLPKTAQERVDIAKRILEAALKAGIPREDVWIDCLTLTISAQPEQGAETLAAVQQVRSELGLQILLGVSNVSFGLPHRGAVTRTFLDAALGAGLTLPILNPNQYEMMDAVVAWRVLHNEDPDCRRYIARFANAAPEPDAPGTRSGLEDAVIRGLRSEAARQAAAALGHTDPVTLVETRLVPALDKVGEGYEAGTLFLPQLLAAAGAAQEVFAVIREKLAQSGDPGMGKAPVVLATVKGDIHDIGKNIAKAVLENYGYPVIDLGRDVPPEQVAAAVKESGAHLVGLSALMTTTLPAMEETVALLRALPYPPRIMVGGAVVTGDYAQSIGADYFVKDARADAAIAREVLG